MKQKIKVLSAIVLLAVVLQLSGYNALASTTPLEDNTSVVYDESGLTTTISSSPAQQKAALAYWTRQAIAQAKPMEMPSQSGSAAVDESALADQEAAVGEFGSSPGGVAAPNAIRIAQAAFPRDWKQSPSVGALTDALSLGDMAGTTAVYTSYTVNSVWGMYTLYPHTTIGQLTFSTPSGTSYCSATSISNNHFVTAAHCVYDTSANVWYSNWVFTPAYKNGLTPFGSFAYTSCTILNAWINLSGSYSINSWAQHDVAVCGTGLNASFQTLNNAVGWAGRQWNYSYTRHFFNMGYPLKNYTDAYLPSGGYLRTCVAESFQYATETRGMGCNWGGGISGGPWLSNYIPGTAGAANYVDGVNSGLFINQQNIYGARFNSNNIVSLCTSEGC